MAYIKTLNVLNTVTTGGTDCSVDANGVVTFKGGSLPQTSFPAKNLTSITIQAAVSEQLEVYTITPTYVADATYTLIVQGYNSVTGVPLTMRFTVTADGSLATADATGICGAFRTQITAVGYPLNIVGSGTTTLILTASGIGTTGYTDLACFVVGSPDTTNMTISNGTDGIPVRGSVGALSATNGGKYQLVQTNIQGGYPALSNLTSGSVYTEVDINYIIYKQTGDNRNWTIENAQLVLLVKESATNFADLLGVDARDGATANGTIVALKAGYALTIVAVTTVGEKAAAIAATTGIITLSGSSSPTFYSEGITIGDIVNITTTFDTVLDIGTTVATPQVTGLGNTTSSVSASAYRVFKYRMIPLG